MKALFFKQAAQFKRDLKREAKGAHRAVLAEEQAVLRASRALFWRTLRLARNNWTAYRCPCRWPAATCPDLRLLADYAPSLRSPWRPAVVKIIEAPAKDQPLTEKHRDHALTGEWKDHRDCHVRPNLALIYRKRDDAVDEIRGDLNDHKGTAARCNCTLTC